MRITPRVCTSVLSLLLEVRSGEVLLLLELVIAGGEVWGDIAIAGAS